MLAMLLLCLRQEVISQKQIGEREQTWIGYFNQSRFTAKSGVWADMHFRWTDQFIKEKTFSIVRVGYIYYAGDQIRITAGYAYAARYSQQGVRYVPEHRPWQQLQWLQQRKGLNVSQAFRIEQRFRGKVEDGELSGEYIFNWRFRYNFSFTIPLKGRALKPKTPFLLFSDEIHINAGKNIIYNYFDQNRFFAGIGYQFTPQLNAHLGHLFIFQHESTPGRYLHIHALRLFVIHNLDFRNDGVNSN